jgi:hypothetical protein
MLRPMKKLLLAPLAAMALILPAQAQRAAYCNGAVVADIFDTRVVVGPAGRATYSVRLRNTNAQPKRLVVNVTAPILGRPTGAPHSLAPGGSLLVPLGYQPNIPGSQPLRGERLEQVTRVSCL